MQIKLHWIALTVLVSIAAVPDATTSLQQFIVHLESGDKWDDSVQPAEQTQFQEHSANMNRLRKEGTILFGARYGEYGLLIVEGESLQSVTEMLEADPGVVARIFRFQVEPINIFYPWKTLDD